MNLSSLYLIKQDLTLFSQYDIDLLADYYKIDSNFCTRIMYKCDLLWIIAISILTNFQTAKMPSKECSQVTTTTCLKHPEILECDKVTDFMNKYREQYVDYNSYPDADDFADICFATADFSFELFSKGKVTKTNDITDILYDPSFIVYMDVDSDYQSHALTLIPLTVEYMYVIQSLGGIFAPFGTLWRTTEFYNQLKCLLKLQHSEELFGFYDTMATYITVSFRVSKRREISAKLLPDLTPLKDKLIKLYAEEGGYSLDTPKKPFTPLFISQLGLEIFRPQDAYYWTQRNYERLRQSQ